MTESRNPAFLLVILAMVALFARTPAELPGRGGTPAVSSRAETTLRSASAAATPEAAYRLIGRHFGLPEDASRPEIEEHAKRGGARVVLASVPDPADSHLAFAFDAHVDAIVRAASDRGYALESWTFPWSRDESRRLSDLATPRASPADATAAGRAPAESADGIRHRFEPGVLLFASRGLEPGADELLLVLLIGEGPTFGVHPRALYTALDLHRTLAAPLEEIALIGPTYSGSARQLGLLVSRWAQRPGIGREGGCRVSFVTGTATASRAMDQLKVVGSPCEIDARRVVHDDPALIRGFREYLEAMGKGVEPRIAYVTERVTAYGSSLPEVGTAGAALLELSFPLHLAQLRAASERTRDGESKRVDLDSPLARRALELAMDDDGQAIDVPRSYSPRESANIAELELASTLQALRRDRIEYAVLGATDVRDQLFLAQLLRRLAPEVHLVSLTSDVLYNHPRFSQDLIGMLVVSSSPLTSRLPRPMQRWTGLPVQGSDARQDSFPSSLIEGNYRAALLAIGGPDRCERPGAPDPVLPCEWLQSPLLLPVWVSAVGRDSQWPIWVSSPSGLPALPQIALSQFFRVCLVLLSLLGLYHASSYLLGSEPSGLPLLASSPIPGSMLSWLFRGSAGSETSDFARRATCLVLLATSLALLSGLTVIALQPFLAARVGSPRHGSWSADLVLAFPVLACVALAAAAVRASANLYPAWVPGKASAIGAGVMLAPVLLYLVDRVIGGSDPIHRTLLALRATHFESGLSPVAPVFLLGAGSMWMIAVLARHRLLFDRFSEVNPFRGADSPLWSPVLCSAERLREQMRPWSVLRAPSPVRWAALVGFVITPAVLFIPKASLPVDSRGWYWIFCGSALVLTTGIVGSITGVLAVWNEMRKLMRALCASPLRDAFGRLPVRFGRTVGFEPTATPALLSDLQYSVDQCRLLARLAEKLEEKGGLEPQLLQPWLDPQFLAALEQTLGSDARKAAETHQRIPAIFGEAQAELTERAARLRHTLEILWQDFSGLESEEIPSDKTSQRPIDAVSRIRSGAKPSARLWLQLAEELVAAQAATFLSYLFIQMRSALRGSTAALVLMLLAMTSYPIEPQAAMLGFLLVMIAAAVASAIVTFTQASRNELLSLLEGTRPNHVTWNGNLVLQLTTYVAIPLLAALASQLPVLGRLVSTLFSAIATR